MISHSSHRLSLPIFIFFSPLAEVHLNFRETIILCNSYYHLIIDTWKMWQRENEMKVQLGKPHMYTTAGLCLVYLLNKPYFGARKLMMWLPEVIEHNSLRMGRTYSFWLLSIYKPINPEWDFHNDEQKRGTTYGLIFTPNWIVSFLISCIFAAVRNALIVPSN